MTGRTLDIPTPRAFLPLLAPRDFKGAKGGRGGAKSHFFAGMLVEDCLRMHIRAACLREVQHTIKDSVKQLIEDKIAAYGAVHLFRITDREITGPNDSLIIFRGLQNHTAASLKSLTGFNRALYEEAQTLSKRSLDLALPTFREKGTEQWFAWNPDKATDPVDVMFRDNKDNPDYVCVEVNYYENPWFPENLRRQMERDKARDPDKYGHIWLGDYRKNSEARVFRHWRVERFETPTNAQFLLGADWGFSVDPTVLVRCYIIGRTLYVDREVYKVGCEIDRTPAFFDQIDPAWTAERARDPAWKSIARRLPITADSARPETISYMRAHGFPLMRPAIKGAGSVEDGITHLQSYDIVVHPDNCPHVVDELTMCSFKIDKHTSEITSDLDDRDNHTIDSLRYALENVRRSRQTHAEPLRL